MQKIANNQQPLVSAFLRTYSFKRRFHKILNPKQILATGRR